MKNPIIILSFLFFPWLTHWSYGQTQDLQNEVQKVIEKYQGAPSLKLDFEFQLTYPEQHPQIFEGTFYKLNDVYKVDLDAYTIYSDGKAQYTVQKDAQEVQITNIDTGSIELSSPAGILKYLENQNFKYFDKSSLKQGGQSLRIIEMVPTDKSSDYFKIRFSFTGLTKQLKYIEIFARDGQRIQLTVGDTSFSGNFSRKSIEWDKGLYKDYYIEDLRID